MLGVGAVAVVTGAIFSFRSAREPDGMAILRDAQVTDLSGKSRSLLEWQGRTLVINFWATWCEPCREEIPAFVQVRRNMLGSGVEFVGIAIDQAVKVSSFAQSLGIDYPLLLAEGSGIDLMRRLGNPSGSLPFTVIFDRKGNLSYRHLGTLTRQKVETQLLGMLQP